MYRLMGAEINVRGDYSIRILHEDWLCYLRQLYAWMKLIEAFEREPMTMMMMMIGAKD